MKLQKLSALKALGMNVADDERAEVTTGEHRDEPEPGSLDPGSPQPRKTIKTPNVSTLEERKLAESRRQMELALASFGESKSYDKYWVDLVHTVSMGLEFSSRQAAHGHVENDQSQQSRWFCRRHGTCVARQPLEHRRWQTR